jgi:cell division septation protein DedD
MLSLINKMYKEVCLAMIGGQWFRIHQEDGLFYQTRKCLTRSIKDESESSSGRVRKYQEDRNECRGRRGSPLDKEYHPEDDMTWKCIEINGQSQWVEQDWDAGQPRRRWGWESDSDDERPDENAVESPGDFEQFNVSPVESEDLIGELARELDAFMASEFLKRQEARRKHVSSGQDVVHEIPLDEGERAVKFGEDIFLEDESEERRLGSRFGGLKAIESLKETKLRRKLLIPSSQAYNCKGCSEQESHLENRSRKSVSSGITVCTEIPEEWVRTTNKPKTTKSATAIDDPAKQSDFVRTTKPKDGDDCSKQGEQQLVGRYLSKTGNKENATKSVREPTIKYAPTTVVKETPASQLPILRIFPGFLAVPKPILKPCLKRNMVVSRYTSGVYCQAENAGSKTLSSSQTWSATWTCIAMFVITMMSFVTRSNSQSLEKRGNLDMASKNEVLSGDNSKEVQGRRVVDDGLGLMWNGQMQGASRRRFLRNCEY